mgnify:CR=1 FL=1
MVHFSRPAGDLSFWGNSDEENRLISTVETAIKNGVNYIDTAPWYRRSEENLGIALKNIPRKAFFIGTKVNFCVLSHHMTLKNISVIFSKPGWKV